MINKLVLSTRFSFVLAFLFVAFATPIFAQETITLQEEKVADFYPKNILKSWAKGYLFKVGDSELQVIGRKGENLEKLLIQDDEAYKQFKKFKRKVTTGKVVFWLSVGTFVGESMTPYQEYTSEVSRRRSFIRLSSVVIGGTTTIIYRALAVRNLKKSIRIYNENLKQNS